MSAAAPERRVLLILGGTGFVGSAVAEVALSQGWQVVSLSRRGRPAPGGPGSRLEGVDWRQGDAANPTQTLRLVKEIRPQGIVHCIGALFDAQSWLRSWNKRGSVSGSEPADKDTYDRITFQTASSALHATVVLARAGLPFAFISAAEAGWGFGEQGCLGSCAGLCAPPWLRRYLRAKRRVEDALLRGIDVPPACRQRSNKVRPIIFRPSIVYSPSQGCRVEVALFKGLSAARIPCVSRPVELSVLARAVVAAVSDEGVSGVQLWRDMEALARRLAQ
eukprot:TRINITY_DN61941_c0_g1_i1.p2 TRINITY_DN61941_c0_g1~~TRINITY_DN61941_c0_g1_i1.p2  ORF type:complete len:277 (+),score=77.10 TRINITY_DN61941_c0_g1_i1:89-919(+)